MSSCNLRFGDLIWVSFPEQQLDNNSKDIRDLGHEQVGKRPAIVIFNPYDLGMPRFELITVAPITSKEDPHFLQSPILYPSINPDSSGLSIKSYILLDQLRAIDIRRITNYAAPLSQIQLALVKACLKKILPK